jgi:hypothetical protein
MKRFIKTTILLVIISIIGLVIHETGHAITAILYGAKVTYIQFFNIQVWPTIKYLNCNGLFGGIKYTPIDQNGLVTFMGSGSTAILGLLFAIGLFAIKSRGWVWFICLFTAILLPLDIISYSVFPAIGLRHWIIFGGYGREPLEGALKMGVTQTTYYSVLVAYILICYGLVIYNLRRMTSTINKK